MGRLDGKVAIVTGAASTNGFGFASALLFAREGARLLLTDIKSDAVADRAQSLRDQGFAVTAIAHDVTRQEGWDQVRDRALADHGRIDIVINNAGMALPGEISEISLDDWNRHLAVNLSSVFLGCQMAVRQMRAQGGGGSIINISSTAGLSAFANLAAYCASKGGVRLLTKAAALDVAAEGIRINSVHPGHLDTDMISGAREVAPAMVAAMEANVPMKFLGAPSDVASMNLFLASDESRYVTGAEFVVDGGLTAK
jgi:NAD(P)-dependent dehydrogenase (short-subunit alcohol dehydrogenase family)